MEKILGNEVRIQKHPNMIIDAKGIKTTDFSDIKYELTLYTKEQLHPTDGTFVFDPNCFYGTVWKAQKIYKCKATCKKNKGCNVCKSELKDENGRPYIQTTPQYYIKTTFEMAYKAIIEKNITICEYIVSYCGIYVDIDLKGPHSIGKIVRHFVDKLCYAMMKCYNITVREYEIYILEAHDKDNLDSRITGKKSIHLLHRGGYCFLNSLYVMDFLINEIGVLSDPAFHGAIDISVYKNKVYRTGLSIKPFTNNRLVDPDDVRDFTFETFKYNCASFLTEQQLSKVLIYESKKTTETPVNIPDNQNHIPMSVVLKPKNIKKEVVNTQNGKTQVVKTKSIINKKSSNTTIIPAEIMTIIYNFMKTITDLEAEVDLNITNVYTKKNDYCIIEYTSTNCINCGQVHSKSEGIGYIYINRSEKEYIHVAAKSFSCFQEDLDKTAKDLGVDKVKTFSFGVRYVVGSPLYATYLDIRYEDMLKRLKNINIEDIKKFKQFFFGKDGDYLEVIKERYETTKDIVSPNVSIVKKITDRSFTNNDFDLLKYHTTYIKGYEGSAKSYSTIKNLIQCYKLGLIKRIVYTAANIATLANCEKVFKRLIKEEGFDNVDTLVQSYKKNSKDGSLDMVDINAIRYSPILLVTLNSLHYLESEKEYLVFPIEETIFVVEEVSKYFNYFKAKTLDNERHKSCPFFVKVMKKAKHMIFICADLIDYLIDSVEEVRKPALVSKFNEIIVDKLNKAIETQQRLCDSEKKDMVEINIEELNKLAGEYRSILYINEHIVCKRRYVELKDETEIISKVKILLENNKKIAIASDSKTMAIQLELSILKLLPKTKIYIVHGDSNNNNEELVKIEETIMLIKPDVLIYSPSLAIGISIDIDYFDTQFAYFCTCSVTAREAHQLTKRIRQLHDLNVYVVFAKNVSNKRITDTEIIEKVLNGENLETHENYNSYDNRTNEIRPLIRYSYNKVDGNTKYQIHDFVSKMLLWGIVEENCSINNFKYYFIAQVYKRKSNYVYLNMLPGDIVSTLTEEEKLLTSKKIVTEERYDIETNDMFNIMLSYNDNNTLNKKYSKKKIIKTKADINILKGTLNVNTMDYLPKEELKDNNHINHEVAKLVSKTKEHFSSGEYSHDINYELLENMEYVGENSQIKKLAVDCFNDDGPTLRCCYGSQYYYSTTIKLMTSKYANKEYNNQLGLDNNRELVKKFVHDTKCNNTVNIFQNCTTLVSQFNDYKNFKGIFSNEPQIDPIDNKNSQVFNLKFKILNIIDLDANTIFANKENINTTKLFNEKFLKNGKIVLNNYFSEEDWTAYKTHFNYSSDHFNYKTYINMLRSLLKEYGVTMTQNEKKNKVGNKRISERIAKFETDKIIWENLLIESAKKSWSELALQLATNQKLLYNDITLNKELTAKAFVLRYFMQFRTQFGEIPKPIPTTQTNVTKNIKKPVTKVESTVTKKKPVTKVESTVTKKKPVTKIESTVTKKKPVTKVESIVTKKKPVTKVESIVTKAILTSNVKKPVTKTTIAKKVKKICNKATDKVINVCKKTKLVR